MNFSAQPLASGVRRAIDVTASAAGLLLLSPLFLGAAAAIKLFDPGPVFYGHHRVGRDFRPFRIWKFRTMVSGSDRLGPPLTSAGDARVTRIGRLLRRGKIDELPQLFNVLRGEMSLVGPRPEVARYVARFPGMYTELLRVRPGITDPASLAYAREESLLAGDAAELHYCRDILPVKLALSLDYLSRRTLRSDWRIIWRTCRCLFRPGNKAGLPRRTATLSLPQISPWRPSSSRPRR